MRSAGLTHVVSLGRLERRSKKKGGEIPLISGKKP